MGQSLNKHKYNNKQVDISKPYLIKRDQNIIYNIKPEIIHDINNTGINESYNTENEVLPEKINKKSKKKLNKKQGKRKSAKKTKEINRDDINEIPEIHNKNDIKQKIDKKNKKIDKKINHSSNKYISDPDNINIPQTTEKYKKKAIPKKLKQLVWNKYIGAENGIGLCCCCEETEISQFEYDCCHIKSEVQGGDTTLNNLIPGCSSCNKSMLARNFYEYKKEFYGPSKNGMIKLIYYLGDNINYNECKNIIINKIHDIYNTENSINGYLGITGDYIKKIKEHVYKSDGLVMYIICGLLTREYAFDTYIKIINECQMQRYMYININELNSKMNYIYLLY